MRGRDLLVVFSIVTLAREIKSEPHEKCFLPLAEGTCQEQELSWYYNNATGLCQTFLYSGCGGNANNFNSSMYCLHACNGSTGDLHSYSIAKDSKEEIKRKQEAAVSQERPKRDTTDIKTDNTVKRRGGKTDVAAPGPVESSVALGEDIATLKKMVSQLSQSISELKPSSSGSRNREHQEHREQREQRNELSKKRHRTSINVSDSASGHPLQRSGERNVIDEKSNVSPSLPVTTSTNRKKSSSVKLRGRKRKGQRPCTSVQKSNEQQQRHLGDLTARHEISGKKGNEKHVTVKQIEKQTTTTTVTAAGGSNEEDTPKERSKKGEVVRGRTPSDKKEDKDDDNEVNVISDRIRSIIKDPSFSFSCNNITADDMTALNEMAAQSEFAALQMQEVVEEATEGGAKKALKSKQMTVGKGEGHDTSAPEAEPTVIGHSPKVDSGHGSFKVAGQGGEGVNVVLDRLAGGGETDKIQIDRLPVYPAPSHVSVLPAPAHISDSSAP